MTEIRRLSIAELEAEPADALFLLICVGYNGQFWNERGGYGINPCDAKLWTRDEAIRQIKQGHERREVAVSAAAYVDAFREFVARVEAKRAINGWLDEVSRAAPNPMPPPSRDQ